MEPILDVKSLAYLRQLLLEVQKTKLEWNKWLNNEIQNMRGLDLKLTYEQKRHKLIMRKESKAYHEKLSGLYAVLGDVDIITGFVRQIDKML